MPSEFDLIRRHFTRPSLHTDLAVGDDAALVRVAADMQLAVTTDTLVAGTHFFPDTAPRDLGWKTLAVNLSDLAAMGAAPRWATLAITLPGADEKWLAAFADGFFDCANRYGVDIVGGDTTRGPLAMTVTLFGEVPAGAAITRAGGRPGDDLWISGQPGLAALGLAHLQGRARLADASRALAALHRPTPRLELGLALRGLAHAMLDVSDGLVGDLGHLCEHSALGATLDATALPTAALRETGADEAFARRCLLTGGDDYELLFAAPPAARDAIAALARRLDLPVFRIGQLTAHAGPVLLREADGGLHVPGTSSYDHFMPASRNPNGSAMA
ncbi:MAG: thiamine-phosphate kinase [Azoarcus sp.]|jgi:thiamine-monophosphate kinase|nr:thiamine-phosphate kinase [Azoarcus sp.]